MFEEKPSDYGQRQKVMNLQKSGLPVTHFVEFYANKDDLTYYTYVQEIQELDDVLNTTESLGNLKTVAILKIHCKQPHEPTEEEKRELKYSYFVSYTWVTSVQRGDGCLHMMRTSPVKNYSDIESMLEWLNTHIKDEYGNRAKCVIRNYIPLNS